MKESSPVGDWLLNQAVDLTRLYRDGIRQGVKSAETRGDLAGTVPNTGTATDTSRIATSDEMRATQPGPWEEAVKADLRASDLAGQLQNLTTQHALLVESARGLIAAWGASGAGDYALWAGYSKPFAAVGNLAATLKFNEPPPASSSPASDEIQGECSGCGDNTSGYGPDGSLCNECCEADYPLSRGD